MVRMHAPGKGIAASALPYRRTVPSWQKSTAEEIKDVIYKLAKKGKATPNRNSVFIHPFRLQTIAHWCPSSGYPWSW